MKMYVEIETRLLTGIYKVNQIIGNIVSVDNNGTNYDCYISKGDIKRFCNEDGTNFIFNEKT
jgi:hypothetical protein